MQVSSNQSDRFMHLRKLPSGVMNIFHSIVQRVEAESTSIISCIFTFIACVLLRNFLEGYTAATGNLFNADSLALMITLAHMAAFNIAIALSLSIIMHYVTNTPIFNVLKIVLPSFILLSIAPSIDYFFPSKNIYGYTYFSNFENHSLLLSYLTFFGQFSGITIGMKIEIFTGLIALFLYGYDKTHTCWKALFGCWLSYTAIFSFLASQFIMKGMADFVGVFYMPSGFSFLAYFFILSFILTIWVSFLLNKKYFTAIAREIPILRVIHYELMFLLGICIAFQCNLSTLLGEAQSNPAIISYIIFIVIAIFLAFLFAMVTNNIEDIEIDKISNSDRALVAGKISKQTYSNIAYTCMGIALIFAAPAGPHAVFFIMLFMGIYYIYSVYPLRIKRITIISKLAISANSLFLFLLGYWLINHNFMLLSDANINTAYVAALFVLFTLAANFIDLKDYNGDKAANIKTLPVVLGLRYTQYFCGTAFLLLYILTGLNLFTSTVLYSGLVLAGIAQFYLLTRKQYNEVPVLLLYIMTLLFLILAAFSTSDKITLSYMITDNTRTNEPNQTVNHELETETQEEMIKRKIAALIINYNAFFKTDFKTIDELKPAALLRVQQFYTAVRNCTPGTYQYILQYIPGVAFYTSVIEGVKNGACLVESTYTIPHHSEATKTCYYTPATQLLFSEEQAEYDGSGKFRFDRSSPTPFQRGEISECRLTTKLLTN